MTTDPKSRAFAQHLDSIDPISHLRNEFYIPTKEEVKSSAIEFDLPTNVTNGTTTSGYEDDSEKCIYFCGNSLGLQPIRTRKLVDEELNVWARRGVMGHFDHTHDRPWVSIDDQVTTYMSQIVGAQPSEVAVMGTLTSNIHFLLAAFYKPTKERYKIIMEAKAFPSDQYAIASQLVWHNLDPATALVTIAPTTEHNQYYLITSQILKTIDDHHHDTALVMLSGLQYYTGQAFDMQTITKYAKDRGITVGWDLAHAVGNIPLSLHDWDVDFAAWCSYKYLNSGPGGIAGIYVNEKHNERHRLAGWWGHDRKTRFIMGDVFKPIPGAAGFQHSNPSVLSTVCLLASLQVFSQTSMAVIRQKSVQLTNYLETILNNILESHSASTSQDLPVPFRIITPSSVDDRGTQISILFREGIMVKVLKKLEKAGIIVDERKPDVIRIAPVPLYNSFEEVWRFGQVFENALKDVINNLEAEEATKE